MTSLATAVRAQLQRIWDVTAWVTWLEIWQLLLRSGREASPGLPAGAGRLHLHHASPLTLPVGQEATSPVPKRSRNPGAVAATRASTGFSMVLRGSASAAFKPTALDTFKTPTSTRRISATKTPTLRVPSFSLSPAARTPTMRSTSVAAPAQKPFGITSSSPAGVSRLPDVTPTKGVPTTPRTFTHGSTPTHDGHFTVQESAIPSGVLQPCAEKASQCQQHQSRCFPVPPPPFPESAG